MRSKPLNAGIETEMVATLLLRKFHHPLEQSSAKPVRPIRVPRNQIVYIQGPTREKEVHDPKPSHGPDDTIEFKKCELVTFILLMQHP